MDKPADDLDTPSDSLDIAIIGMNLKVPGARDLDTFWCNLRNGVESVSFFTDEELAVAGVSAADIADPHYVKAFGLLEDVDKFDASFFDFTPRDVEVMDPQHRLLLERAWELLEGAGYDAGAFDGRIGVFAGVGLNSYLLNHLGPNPQIINAIGSWQVGMSNDKDFAPTRVSYKLDLTGPSISVNTGCSTSLVAVAMGCQSLLNYQCDMVLAGGATIQSPQDVGYWYHAGGVSSPDGHCRPFDAAAQGTLDASGVALVLLKKLDDALVDGDIIHAVIKGFAINNDGALKVGYTAPSVEGQADVIIEAQNMAGLSAETIGFIEAHGTGTELGDSVEVAALTQAFRHATDKKEFCALGSLKSNLGHLDTAAGVASLIKTVLAMQHRQIPPTVHFEKPNPKIDFANSPFYVNGELREWEAGATPRRAGVSSFGIGGTNAHVVIEEAPPLPVSGPSRPWQMLLLSARTETALERMTENLASYLQRHADADLADVAYTLALGRKAFAHRRVLVCQTAAEGERLLQEKNPQSLLTHVLEEQGERPVLFMFPGMGAEYMNMALELYEQEPVFREQVDVCADLLKSREGLDFFQIWETEGLQKAPAHLAAPVPRPIAPAALFIIEYSLARMWMCYGVQPQAMLGYSGGEYVAACLAEVLSLEDALSLVATSGRLTEGLPAGSMLAISLPEEEVDRLLTGSLSLAAVNGVSLCLVSGATDEVERLQNELLTKGTNCFRLSAPLAYHSAAMEPIIVPLLKQFDGIELKPPRIPWISGVTGTWITDAQAISPEYYARQIVREPVRFVDNLQELFAHPEFILLEIGPGQVLSPLVMQHPAWSPRQAVLSTLKAPQYAQPEQSSLLTALGKLWLSGGVVDWSEFYAQEERQRLSLPTYPFERKSYWIEPGLTAVEGTPEPGFIGKRADIADWFYLPSWHRSHVIGGSSADRKAGSGGTDWLVFVDREGFGSQLPEQLRAKGNDVVTVHRGAAFAQLDRQTYVIDEKNPEDYQALFKAVRDAGEAFSQIVHAWLLAAADDEDSAHLDRGFYSLLYLGQALGREFSTSITVNLLSSDIHEVTGGEQVCPEKAAALGPLKVIPQEFPGINSRSIDVQLPVPGSWQERRLSEQLMEELTASPTHRMIAFRGNHGWFRSFDPIKLEEGGGGTRLREEGVYLITGGLGNIGLALADYLAKKVRARLILTGRSVVPPREEWDQWLATHAEEDSTSQKLRRVLALEERGAEVLIASADTANCGRMEELMGEAEARFGSLNGVVHAAGIVGEASFCTISEADRADCEKHFQSKVYGTGVLERLLGDRKLDFCIAISSLSSLLGGLGFAAYAGANSYMDAFVDRHNQAHEQRWISANLEGWEFAGPEDDMAQAGGVAELAMTPPEGIEAWERILSEPSAFNQLVASSGDLLARIDQWVDFDPAREEAASQDSQVRHSRPDLMNAYTAPRDELETQLVEIWEKTLGMGPIGIYDSFFELGGNSLLVTQLVAQVRMEFQMEIPLGKLFNEPRIADVAEQIKALRIAAQMQIAPDDVSGERDEGVL
jgi:acyl transferase domain-containing protein/acyl carrier protein